MTPTTLFDLNPKPERKAAPESQLLAWADVSAKLSRNQSLVLYGIKVLYGYDGIWPTANEIADELHNRGLFININSVRSSLDGLRADGIVENEMDAAKLAASAKRPEAVRANRSRSSKAKMITWRLKNVAMLAEIERPSNNGGLK